MLTMKKSHLLIYFTLSGLVLFGISCSANQPLSINRTLVSQLLQQNLSADAKLAESVNDPFKAGDFNGDGLDDIAALFTFDTKPESSTELKVMMPWDTQQQNTQAGYRTGLAILHGNGEPWLSGKKQTFALLDTVGVLETPSFELWVQRKTDEGYDAVRSMLPTAVAGDLIILPTEAGIDTYLYWQEGSYTFFAPDEMP